MAQPWAGGGSMKTLAKLASNNGLWAIHWRLAFSDDTAAHCKLPIASVSLLANSQSHMVMAGGSL